MEKEKIKISLVWARLRLSDPQCFCFDAFARDLDGNAVSPLDRKAVRYSLLGAIYSIVGNIDSYMEVVLTLDVPSICDIVKYDSLDGKSYKDVLALLDRTIEELETP